MKSPPRLASRLAPALAPVLALAACGTVQSAAPDGGADDDGAASAAARCSPTNLEACKYASELHFEVGVADLELTDPARSNLSVPLRVHYPVGASDARPVVIWNHGGLPSANGRTRSEEWGKALAAAGYVVIHPSRVVVEPAPFQTLCEREGFPVPADCQLFVSQVVFGPATAAFAIDSLAAIEAAVPALAGRIDAAHLAVAGHSAGSAMPLALAGAVRQFAGPPRNSIDTRPIAFLASGPQGPDYAGFDTGFREDSFHAIDARPFLWITGRGDETGDEDAPQHEPSEARASGWLTSTRGDKLLSWDNDEVAVHETMDIHRCDQSPVQRAHCDAFAMLGTAFLDAHLRRRDAAIAYLASSSYDALSAGVIELHRR
jgi:predicted dienelactone hydrolase